ncbi:MAG: lipocalin-like domain-containing protein [Pseudomonadota bacterium]
MESNRNRFLGSWKLSSWQCEADSGEKWYPYGEGAVGYIVYTAEGLVSATLMKAERPRIGLSRKQRISFSRSLHKMQKEHEAADAETLDVLQKHGLAATTYTAYCGIFSVEQDCVIHRVRTSLYPDWVGTDLVRVFSFQDDQLHLTARVGELMDTLIWQRIENLD